MMSWFLKFSGVDLALSQRKPGRWLILLEAVKTLSFSLKHAELSIDVPVKVLSLTYGSINQEIFTSV